MRVLLDTCVLSEIRHAKGDPAVKGVVAALDADALFISVLSIGEIAKGIARLEAGSRKRELEAWLQAVERYHAPRILPVDLEAARIWGGLSAAAQKTGNPLPAVDGLIAATAIRHGLYVMTRNVDDFKATGVLLLNPWKG